jgi:ferritin
MLSNTMLAEMNAQVKHELYSAYLYLSMAAHFEAANLGGFASWMRFQAAEEQEHAMKFFDQILDRGGKVALQAIEQPPVEFTTPLAIFEKVQAHEQQVTALIHKLYALAVKEGDYASQIFLGWFVTEQVEEEKNASTILETLKLIGDKSNAIYQLDHQLGKRAAD